MKIIYQDLCEEIKAIIHDAKMQNKVINRIELDMFETAEFKRILGIDPTDKYVEYYGAKMQLWMR